MLIELADFAGSSDINIKKVSEESATVWLVDEPSVSAVSASDITYGQTLSQSIITANTGGVTGSWAWEFASTAPNAGTQSFYAVFTPDSSSYRPTKVLVSVKTNKATPSVETPALIPKNYVSGLKLLDMDLPERWTWNTPNELLSVGEHLFAATYTPADTTNYNTVVRSIAVKVLKSAPAYVLPVIGDFDYTAGRTLGSVALPTGWEWDNPLEIITAGQKTYNATFTPEDTENYGTVTKPISFTVNKATPSYTLPAPAAVTYSPQLTLESVVLPSSWAWVSPTTSLTAGNKSYNATFTPADTENYRIVTAGVVFIVNKAVPTPATPEIGNVAYRNGLILGGISLPAGWSWSLPGKALTLGTNEFTAVYTPSDTQNYESITRNIFFTVIKGQPDIPTVEPGGTYTGGLTLADIPLPQGWAWQDPTQPVSVGNNSFTAVYSGDEFFNSTSATINFYVAPAKPSANILLIVIIVAAAVIIISLVVILIVKGKKRKVAAASNYNGMVITQQGYPAMSKKKSKPAKRKKAAAKNNMPATVEYTYQSPPVYINNQPQTRYQAQPRPAAPPTVYLINGVPHYYDSRTNRYYPLKK